MKEDPTPPNSPPCDQAHHGGPHQGTRASMTMGLLNRRATPCAVTGNWCLIPHPQQQLRQHTFGKLYKAAQDTACRVAGCACVSDTFVHAPLSMRCPTSWL
jgi:hypothetical protein